MNESSLSSKFQTDLRKELLNCEVIKHADKSMIGMVDASVTCNKITVWMEYKYIAPTTKGVAWRDFLKHGVWFPRAVAEASPTQFDKAKRLACVGHCCYLFWVLDHSALRKRLKHIIMWNPLNDVDYTFENNEALIKHFANHLALGSNPLDVIK